MTTPRRLRRPQARRDSAILQLRRITNRLTLVMEPWQAQAILHMVKDRKQGKPGVGRFTLGADVDWTEIDGERI